MTGKKRSRSKGKSPAEAPRRADGRHKFRIRVVLFSFLLLFSSIAGRLALFQIDADLRFAQEDLNHIGEIQIHRPRGTIHDRNGRVLATDRNVPSLSVNPSKVREPELLAQYLAPRLDRNIRWVHERVTRKDADGSPMKFVWLHRRMRPEDRARLGDLSGAPDFKALRLEEEAIRYYPEGELASHLLGFANRDGDGGEGLELRYDGYLRSSAGRRKSRLDSKRNIIGFRTLEYEPPSGGDDVYLTIDTALQHTLERELDQVIVDKNARRAMGILMDPDTGAVLAMATRPAFDPNAYMDYEAEERLNRAVIDIFEPGSAFKIVTAAGALEHGLIKPSDLIDCMGGRFNPYGHPIRDTHPMNVASFTECFAASSNIATIKVAALLGPERLEDWIRRFGFGQRTGLRMAGESAGIFRPRKKWSGLSMGSLPMGQEIAVTIPQLAKSFSVIANGGYLVEPHLVERIVTQEGLTRLRHEPEESNRILSARTAEIMQKLCYGVVTHEEGTGSLAAIREYRVGGKTGTAQIADPVNGGYYEDRYTAVFAGFAPLSDPRLTCVIVVQEPMIKRHYGGYVCGPVFGRVMREALVRLNVPPDPMPKGDFKGEVAENWGGVAPEFELALLEPDLIEESLDGLELVPAEEHKTVAGPRLPSFVGMTKREAKALVVSLGLTWDPQGAGRVVRQEPMAGTSLDEVRLCKLIFSNAGRDGDDV